MPNRDGTGPDGKGCGTGAKQGKLAGNTKARKEGFFRRRKGGGRGNGLGRGTGPRDGRGQGRNRNIEEN